MHKNTDDISLNNHFNDDILNNNGRERERTKSGCQGRDRPEI